MSDIRYEVTKKMAVLSANERTGWTKEVKKGGLSIWQKSRVTRCFVLIGRVHRTETLSNILALAFLKKT